MPARGSFLTEKSQDALSKDGRKFIAALPGRQIWLRIRWRIGPRFGHDAALAKD
jgi:hypothetical protein